MKTLYILINIATAIVCAGMLVFSGIPLLFCDSGPASSCYHSTIILAVGPIISIVLVLVSVIYQFAIPSGSTPRPITSNTVAFSLIVLFIALSPILYFTLIAPYLR